MATIIFCDDHRQYAELLAEAVKKECEKWPELFTVGPVFTDGKEVLSYIGEHGADIIFLDIDMPKISGFALAEILCREYKNLKIIFVSAYDNFVYHAFAFSPVAYLRKSHLQEELPGVLQRLRDRLQDAEKQIQLNCQNGIKTVKVRDITYMESNRNYVTVHFTSGMTEICRGTMAEFEKIMQKYDFFRIHSAYLVNLEYVNNTPENGTVSVKDTTLPIAQKRTKPFKAAYMDYVRRCFLS